MRNCHRRSFLLSLLVAVVAVSAFAAEPVTTITVDGMHCPACAKKLSTKMQGLPGVASAAADAKAGVVTVTPKTRTNVSAKSLWELVEASGYKPTKLAGPSGTFTTKPKR